MEFPDGDHLVRLDDAARELSVSVQTIKKYCRCGILRCLQLPTGHGGHWRVWRSSLDAIRNQSPREPV